MNAKCTLCHELFTETTWTRAAKVFEQHVIESHGKPRPGLRLVCMPRPACKPAK
jgi:hypothetical protein